MGIRSWIRSRQRTDPVIEKGNPGWVALYDDAATSGGEPLDQDYANFLKVVGHFPWVQACVDAIITASAAVPFQVVRRTATGDEVLVDHPLLDLFANPNPDEGYGNFWARSVQQWCYTGEIFWTVGDRARTMQDADELWVLRSDRMIPKLQRSNERPIRHWVYQGHSRKVEIPTAQILQIKRPHPTDPIHGLSYLKELEPTLRLMHAAIRWNEAYFRNAARAPGVITLETKPSADELARYKSEFARKHQGVDNAFKPLILWGKSSWTDNGNSPKDMEFNLMLRWAREEIHAVFGVPPIATGLLEHASYANSREQMRIFYTRAIIPTSTAILDAVNSSPLVRAHGPDIFLRHDFSAVDALQPDRRAQAEVDKIYLAMGVKTVNEVRKARGFGDDVPWGEEDPRAGGTTAGEALPESIADEGTNRDMDETSLIKHLQWEGDRNGQA